MVKENFSLLATEKRREREREEVKVRGFWDIQKGDGERLELGKRRFADCGGRFINVSFGHCPSY